MTAAASRPPVSDSAVASVAPAARSRASASAAVGVGATCGASWPASLAGPVTLADVSRPIEDYALIGDRHTAALVGTQRLDRLAVPAPLRLPRLLRGPARRRGERPLAALPGRRLRGHRGATSATRRPSRRRSPPTTGVVTLLDVMPTRRRRVDVVRRVTGVQGTVRMHHEWVVRFDYGTRRPGSAAAEDSDEPVITAVAGPDKLVLRGPRLPQATDHRHVDDFDVARGRRADVLDHLGAVAPAATPGAAPVPRSTRPSTRRSTWVARLRPDRRAPRRRRTPLAADAAPAHPRATPAASSRRRPPRCPRTSAASATGTTATAGCATPPSPSAR